MRYLRRSRFLRRRIQLAVLLVGVSGLSGVATGCGGPTHPCRPVGMSCDELNACCSGLNCRPGGSTGNVCTRPVY